MVEKPLIKIYITEDFWKKIDDVIIHLKEKYGNFIILNSEYEGKFLGIQCYVDNIDNADLITKLCLIEELPKIKNKRYEYIDTTILQPYDRYIDNGRSNDYSICYFENY